MTTHRRVTNPTRTSPPKKGYMQKSIQKHLKQLTKVQQKHSHHKKGK